MITSRRDALKLIGAAPVAAFMGEAIGSIGAMGMASGGIGSGGAGYYPSGHWIAAKQPMILVGPRPDTETATYAYHRWAYWDGATGLQYRLPIFVGFGAFPYVFELLSGPPGMAFGSTYWRPGWVGSDAAANNYGVLLWTPSGAVTGQTNNVSVRVTDQAGATLTLSFSLNTSSTQFVFVDSVNGNDSNPGTISSPYATLAGACGTSGSGKNAGKTVVLKTGTYSSLGFQYHSGASYPASIIGYPGESPSFGGSQNGDSVAMFDFYGNDVFFGSFSINGYDSAVANARAFMPTGEGQRNYWDNITRTNGGYGSSGTNIPGLIVTPGGSVPMQNVGINACFDNNGESGTPGNNYTGFVGYSINNLLVQYCGSTAASSNFDGAWYPKGNIANGCIRGCAVIVSGCTHACDFGQNVSAESPVMGTNETCYHIITNGNMWMPNVSGEPAWGAIWAYRINLLNGVPISNNAQGTGPYTFESAVVQTSVTFPSAGTYFTPSNNSVAASGLLNTSTGKQISPDGTKGAEIL